jgi:hypothetical protein
MSVIVQSKNQDEMSYGLRRKDAVIADSKTKIQTATGINYRKYDHQGELNLAKKLIRPSNFP